MLIHLPTLFATMAIGDFDPSDHFGHDRMNYKDGYPGSAASERKMLRIVYFFLWVLLGFVFPYLEYGTMDWMFSGIISIGFVLFGLIVVIGNYFSPPERWNSTFSENVLNQVMEKYEISDRERFVKTLPDFDEDGNGYFKRTEIEEAAKAFTNHGR